MAHRTVILTALALTAALYGAAAGAPFLYEDPHWMAATERPLQWGIPSRVLTTATYQAVPLRPEAQHAVNLGLHLVNGVLVYLVIATAWSSLVAVGAATVFALHPLMVSSVAYAAARPDLLVTAGALVAAWCALGRPAWWRWALGGGGLLVAATAKEVGVIAVPLVAVTAWVWRRESPACIAAVSATVVGIGAALGTALPTLLHWWTLAPEAGGGALPWADWILRQNAQAWHLAALLPPSPLWAWGFSIDHDALALGPVWLIVSAGLTLAIVGWAAMSARPAAWAVGWIVLSLAPRFVFRTSEFVTEAQLYLPMVGISALVGAALAVLWRTDVSDVHVSPHACA